MILSIIAAMDRNRLIGNNNALPWHLPADFAHFKKITMGKPILMGRKTYDSIGRPLPGRLNIVLTRSENLQIEGVEVVTSFQDAKKLLSESQELMVIGGSGIYQLLLNEVDRIYLTIVDETFEGDAWFPELDMQQWQQVEKVEYPADEKNHNAMQFVTLHRKLL